MTERLEFKKALAYHRETGTFTWKVCRGGGSPKVGEPAGGLTATGYLRIRLNRRGFLAHRLVWLFEHGGWPLYGIDHINGNKLDNRITNLRDVPDLINSQNKVAAPSHSATGFRGVHAQRGRYIARIGVNQTRLYLGSFGTAGEASAAYFAAKAQMHPGFVSGARA